MTKICSVFLVKPHPPSAILNGECPVSETYRYNWEPVSLKFLAHALAKLFGDRIRLKVWHLMDWRDDDVFLQGVANELPSIIAFSELDILVNEVNRLADKIKKISKDSLTVVGGKQTTLLRAGDRFPFTNINYAFRGDGVAPLTQIVRNLLSGAKPADVTGLIKLNGSNIVAGTDAINLPADISSFEAIAIRSIPVENRNLSDYINTYQSFPSINREEPRTASVLIGRGCPYACRFCQSPVEYGQSGSQVMLRKPEQVAQEIVWLKENYGANNFFSLESSLDLDNLRGLYHALASCGINTLPVSGFVRAADIVRAHTKGLLANLVRKGFRVASVGLDVPPGSDGDIYNKSFSYEEQLDCLRICEDLGIIVLATAVASPDVDRHVFEKQLNILTGLPAAEVDIRLAIALRNTPYFRAMESNLLYHPDRDSLYYDRQNYRYQTIQMPGKISPEEAYALVRQFHENYFLSREHTDYVLRMVKHHPDTIPFFRRQYRKRETEDMIIPDEIRAAVLSG